MGNLGAYQLMTTAAKKVGGPIVLAVGTALGGWVVLRAAEAGGKKVFRVVRAKSDGRSQSSAAGTRVFEVLADGDAGGGLSLKTGDKFRVLQRDGDSILVEVLKDENNPYFVSGELLGKISDFRGSDVGNEDKGVQHSEPLKGEGE